MQIVDNNVLRLSNGLKFLYNPKLFNLDTVLAHSLQREENSLTEDLLLKLNSMFNIHEVNFVGTSKIIFKTDRSIQISIEFTKNKITSVRSIAFFAPTFPHLQMLSYGRNRANFEIDKIPLSYEDKTPLSFDRINEVESIVRRLTTLLMHVEFDMIGFE